MQSWGVFDPVDISKATELIVDIQGGEGGEDSKLFTEDLFSIYVKWADSKNLHCEILEYEVGKIVAQFSGPGVWDAFKNEAGKHCVQRIPPTETKGRKQTSYLSVGVLMMPPEKDLTPLNESEIEVKTQCGHGAGGQHQNKTESAVRMTHLPTGIQVFINGRKQKDNRRVAMRILTVRVREFLHEQQQGNYDQIRKNQMDGGRAGKVRTYNFMEGRVVDHRLNKKTGKIKDIMKGKLDILFE